MNVLVVASFQTDVEKILQAQRRDPDALPWSRGIQAVVRGRVFSSNYDLILVREPTTPEEVRYINEVLRTRLHPHGQLVYL